MDRTSSKTDAAVSDAGSESSGLSSPPPSPTASNNGPQNSAIQHQAPQTQALRNSGSPAVRYSLPIHEVGNVTVPAGTSRVHFRVRHEDHRDWNILLQRFRTRYRVQQTPNRSGNRYGLCGAFALWMGFRNLTRVNGWACPPFSRLLQFLSPRSNPAY